MRDNMEIKFSGKGMPGPDGAPNGDLYLTVRVRKIPNFVIMGDDILLIKKLEWLRRLWVLL